MVGRVLHYNFAINQACAKIFVAASSLAIGLWSIEMIRTREMGRGKGIYGAIVTVVTLLALLSGHLRMDIHGFGAVVLLQTVWLIMVGIALIGGGDVKQSQACRTP